MAESEDFQKQNGSTAEKEYQKIEIYQEYQFQDHYFNDEEDSQQLDIQTTYLKRLREQRKRIEDLSLNLTLTREKYEAEAEKCKDLEERLAKTSSSKVQSSIYEQITVQYEVSQQQNQDLKQIVQNLKKEIFDLTAQNAVKLQKMSNDYLNLKKAYSSQKQAFQEKLEEKEQQIEKFQKLLKNKDKQINDITNSLNVKLNSLRNDYEQRIIIEQRKIEKIEKQRIQNDKTQQLENDLSYFMRQNQKLKQQNFKLNKALKDKQRQLAAQSDKLKLKINNYKKQLKARQKDYDQLKIQISKIQKDKKDHAAQRQDLKIQSSKIRQELQIIITKKQNDFYVQKRNLKMTIQQHTKTIQDLFKIKQQLLAKIRNYELIMSRKKAVQKKRRNLLQDEMKQIDKLQKVIDRIVQ